MNRSFKTSFIGRSSVKDSFLRRKGVGKLNLFQNKVKRKPRKTRKKKGMSMEKGKSMVRDNIFSNSKRQNLKAGNSS